MNTVTPTSPPPPARANPLSFRGRANRMEFWSLHIAGFILIFFALMIPIPGDLFPGVLVGMLVFLIFSISVSVRRLHDIGRSGWWIFWGFASFAVPLAIWWVSWASSLFATVAAAAAIFFLFPIVGIFLAASGPGVIDSEIFRGLILASMPGIVMTIIITVMCLTDSDPETNQYGPNPKLNPSNPNHPV